MLCVCDRGNDGTEDSLHSAVFEERTYVDNICILQNGDGHRSLLLFLLPTYVPGLGGGGGGVLFRAVALVC